MEHVSAALDHVAVAGVVDDHRVEPPDVERGLAGGGHRQEEGTLHLALEERANHPDRLAAVIERGVEPLPLLTESGGQPLDLRAGRHEHRDAPLLLDDVPDVALVQEFVGRLGQDLHLGLEPRVERLGGDHLGAVEIARVERRVHRGAEPDEAAAGPLAQGQAELQLGRRLVDLVDDDRIAVGDKTVLKPAPGNPGRHDDHVPIGGVGRGLPLAVDHADVERLLQNRFRDRTDRQGLPGPRARHDPEATSRSRQLPDLLAVLPLEQRIQVQAHRELDRLAGRTRRRNDDDAPRGMGRVAIGVGIGRKMVVAGRMHEGMKGGRGGMANEGGRGSWAGTVILRPATEDYCSRPTTHDSRLP